MTYARIVIAGVAYRVVYERGKYVAYKGNKIAAQAGTFDALQSKLEKTDD